MDASASGPPDSAVAAREREEALAGSLYATGIIVLAGMFGAIRLCFQGMGVGFDALDNEYGLPNHWVVDVLLVALAMAQCWLACVRTTMLLRVVACLAAVVGLTLIGFVAANLLGAYDPAGNHSPVWWWRLSVMAPAFFFVGHACSLVRGRKARHGAS